MVWPELHLRAWGDSGDGGALTALLCSSLASGGGSEVYLETWMT